MARHSRFERELVEMHGAQAMRQARVSVARPGIDHPTERLAYGAVGVFWAGVLIVALFAAGAVAWAMLSSVGAPPIG